MDKTTACVFDNLRNRVYNESKKHHKVRKMKTRQAYYRTKLESQANYAVTNLPLTVIATGKQYFYTHFEEKSYRYDYSLVYILNGRLNFTVDGVPFIFEKGCFALIKPQKHLTFTSDMDFNAYYWLQFSGYDADNLVKGLKLEYEKPYNIGVHEDIKGLFNAIFKEFLINDSLFDTVVAARLTELMVSLCRKATSKSDFSLSSVEYINRHYNEDLTIDFLASLENLSSSRYRTVFRNAMGVSPYEYILSLRINTACFYLTNSTYTIDEIAETAGYSDQFYFSRIFKKKTGLSPLKYRQQNSKEI